MGRGDGKNLANPQSWQLVDMASVVMRYADDNAKKRRAAEIIISRLRGVGWHLNIHWFVNNKSVTLPETITEAAQTAVAEPLVVRIDPQSPFVIDLSIYATVEAPNEDDVIQALNSSQPVKPGVWVKGLAATLNASHSTLGTLYHATWTAPPLVAAPQPQQSPGSAAPKEEEAASDYGPAKMLTLPRGGGLKGRGRSPRPSAPRPAAPVHPPNQSKTGKPMPGGPTPTPTPPPGYLMITGIDSIKAWMAQYLVDCLRASPELTVLPSHLRALKAEEILMK